MKSIYTACIFLVFFLLNNTVHAEIKSFNFQGHAFQLAIDGDAVSIQKNGETLLNLKTEFQSDSLDNIFLSDFNFDGYPDIAILKEQGIEKRYDVFLFNKKKLDYVKNEAISKLACPRTDNQTKTIQSTCNHLNACENWEESYKFHRDDLILVKRKGVTCDPISGKNFKYIEYYKNGRLVKQNTSTLP